MRSRRPRPVSARTRRPLRDGNPEGFEQQAVAALGVLPLLRSGAIEYDGTRWLMSGTVETPEQGIAVDNAVSAAGLRDAGWSVSFKVAEAPAPAVVRLQPLSLARRQGCGRRNHFEGFVPSEGMKRILIGRAGQGATDNSVLGSGQPANLSRGGPCRSRCTRCAR